MFEISFRVNLNVPTSLVCYDKKFCLDDICMYDHDSKFFNSLLPGRDVVALLHLYGRYECRF